MTVIQETRLNDSLTGQSQAYRKLHDLNLTLSNFMKSERKGGRRVTPTCKEGYTHTRLNPVKRKCGDDFTLFKTNIDEVILTHGDYRVPYQPLEFCLFFDDNTTLQAEICRVDVTDKFKLVGCRLPHLTCELCKSHQSPFIYTDTY